MVRVQYRDHPKITASDDEIRQALAEAHIPSLMCALVHLTGDMAIVRGDIHPVSEFFGDPQGGINEEEQAHMRELALQALRHYRDSHGKLPAAPDKKEVSEMVDFLVGETLSPEYGDFLTAELALEGNDAYCAPGLIDLPVAAKADFKVLVIGAGMSGLLSAIRLQEAGVPFTVVEKHPDVGGTWFQNVYPGCRVDSANHMYSYTFKPKDWPQHFSEQEVLRQYFAETADEYDLRKSIRFNTEVTEMVWDEGSAQWHVSVIDQDGNAGSITANAVISAVGQLNRPKWPELPGMEQFAGPSFHSTQWEYEHDLKGKRVAVVGTGASAFQFVPRIAPDAEEVRVFQRTAPWMAPVPEYMQEIPQGKHWLLNNVPYYHHWYRFAVFWRSAEGMLQAIEKDPAWNGDEQVSISPDNELLRQMFLENIEGIVGDDPELLAKCTPDYPVGGKRILFDDGTWLRALTRDNVNVCTDPITEVNAKGLVTQSGEQHDVDVIVYGTGFHASRFLWPMKVVGRDGLVLQEHWDGDPRAYLGITIPQFPNLFCCYGPNTNIVVNGSIIFFSECEVRYIMGCIEMLIKEGARALDCRKEVHDDFNKLVDEANGRMAWGISNANTWYRNDKGRVTQNWPFPLLNFWQRTRSPDPTDYDFVA